MCYFQNLADLLLDAIPNDSTDLEPGTRITIHTFENGDVYEIDHYGRIDGWPQGEIPGDVAESLLCELL